MKSSPNSKLSGLNCSINIQLLDKLQELDVFPVSDLIFFGVRNMAWMEFDGRRFTSMVRTLSLGLLTFGFIVGCGGKKGPTNERPYPVKATLLMDGQPIGPMYLMLSSTQVKGPVISGEADDKGDIKFTTKKLGDGAPAGEYKVVIPKDPLGRAFKPVPDVYRQMSSTPITIKIEAKKNDLKIALDSKAEFPAVEHEDPTMAKKPKPPAGKNVKKPEPPPVPNVDPKLVR